MRPFSTAASRKKSHFPSCASEGSVEPLMQLKKFPNIPVSTQVEHCRSCHNSRRAPFFPPHLEMRVHFPASSGNESWHSCRTSSGDSLNLKLERNSRGCATIQRDPSVPIDSRYTVFPSTDSTVTPRIDSKHNGRCDSAVAPREKATYPYVNSKGSLTVL